MPGSRWVLIAAVAAAAIAVFAGVGLGHGSAANEPRGSILFTRATGHPNLYVMSASGSGVRLLASNASEASVSSDGNWIAFVRNDAIWLMRRDGVGQRQLTHPSARSKKPSQPWANDSSPAWSADGTSVFFVRIGYRNDDHDPSHYFQRYQWIMSVRGDGGDVRRITGGADPEMNCPSNPAPSPDGRVVAYDEPECENGGSGAVLAVDLKGRAIPILRHFPGVSLASWPMPYWSLWGFAPAWSPDGRSLALAVMDIDGTGFPKSGIYVARVDGSGARRVFDASGRLPNIPWPSGWPNAPAWSPDGRWLAFESDIPLGEGYPGELFIVQANGGGLRPLTKTRKIDERDPAWLPPP